MESSKPVLETHKLFKRGFGFGLRSFFGTIEFYLSTSSTLTSALLILELRLGLLFLLLLLN